MRVKICYRGLTSPPLKRAVLAKIAQESGVELCSALGDKRISVLDERFWYEDDPRHRSFVEACRAHDIELRTVWRVEEWSHEELLTFELLSFFPDGFVLGPDYQKMQYDRSNACSLCATGAIQLSDLIIEKKRMGAHDIACASGGQFVVNQRIKQAFEQEGFTGIEFRPTADGRKKRIEGVYHMAPLSVMAPLAAESGVKVSEERTCKRCGAIGFHGLDKSIGFNKLIYKRTDTSGICDLNVTKENFGHATGYSDHRRFMVKSRVYRKLYEMKAKKLTWRPVYVK